MEKSQPSKAVSADVSSISDGSAASYKLENLPLGASVSSLESITVTTPTATQKTWTNVELEALRSRLGLVAGAFQDFQATGGMIWIKNVSQIMPSGKRFSAVKIYLVVEDLDLKAEASKDGIDFNLVATQKDGEK